MKTFKHIFLLFVTVFLVGISCDNFLTENPSTLTTKSDLSSEDAARAFVNSAYSNLTVLNQGSGGWGGNTLELLEFTTGKFDGVPQTEAFKFNDLTYGSDAFYIDTWWNGLYSGVKNANLAISKIENEFSSLPDQQRTDLLAEAKTLRAFYYFYLVRIFGDVPKITGLIESISEMNTARAPVKEIYDDIIIPDLVAAEGSGLPWRDTSGRVSMGFIKSLLADVYLTYAGYPVQGGDQYYTESATRSMEVIESGEFALFDEYTDMIDPSNENSGEFIFQIQYDKTNRNNPLTPIVLPTFAGISSYSNEFGGLVPRQEFIQSYPTGDKRVEEKQYFFTEYAGKDLNGHFSYKYFDKQAIDEDSRSELNFTIYRLADVMLMYAEASNRAQGGPNSDAVDFVNNIRERADLTPISSMSMEEFEKEVWTQRYLELNTEGKMWFDMVRTRKVRNDITKEWDDFVGHTNVFGATFAEKHLVFPIPQREIDNNNNLEQNPGY